MTAISSASIEERLDVLWESWLDDAGSWRPFFERVAGITSTQQNTFEYQLFHGIALRRGLKVLDSFGLSQ